MKQWIVAGLLVLFGLSHAPVSAECSCNSTNFSGHFIGGNIGALSLSAHRNDLDGFLTDNGTRTLENTNFSGGLQFGRNYQFRQQLFGLLMDWNGTSVSKRLRQEPNDPLFDEYIEGNLECVTTIRARSGVVVSETLLYMTGGLAIGRFKTTWHDEFGDLVTKETRLGLTGGFGSEVMVCPGWSVGSEFLLTYFEDKTFTFTGDDGMRFSFNHSDSSWSGRVYLNYYYCR